MVFPGMAWSMAGKTMRLTLLSSVEDWLFMEEVEEAEEVDCCISIVVFELIIFSWDTDVFAEIESHRPSIKS